MKKHKGYGISFTNYVWWAGPVAVVDIVQEYFTGNNSTILMGIMLMILFTCVRLEEDEW